MFEFVLTVPGHIHCEAGEEIQIFHSLINLPLVCQIILVKTYDSKCDIYHHQALGPSSFFCPVLFSLPEISMLAVGGIHSVPKHFSHSSRLQCQTQCDMNDDEIVCYIIVLLNRC